MNIRRVGLVGLVASMIEAQDKANGLRILGA